MAVLCTTCGEAAPCPKGHHEVVDISGVTLNWLQSPRLIMNSEATMNLLAEMIGMEAASTDMEADDAYHGYRPYPLGKFAYLVDAVLAHGKYDTGLPPLFLEVGSGPGTKVLFLLKAFGVEAYGFDINPELVANAHAFLKAYGCADDKMDMPRVWREDAEDYPEYFGYDIVFLNKPLRDYDREQQLELHVAANMKTGSYLILGNGITIPPGMKLIAQDVAAQAYKKVCVCEGAEEWLDLSNDPEAPPFCKRCNRTISPS